MAFAPPVGVDLVGHLTRDALAAALDRATSSIAQSSQPVALLVDCRQMTGYDVDARALFVSWNSSHRSRIRRVAILTANPVWHMLIAAMAVASGQKMKAFAGPDAAGAWLETEGRRPA
jgi:hypothetical protein